jgi:hypothetical protein
MRIIIACFVLAVAIPLLLAGIAVVGGGLAAMYH